jgi:hypothetical protein
MNNYLLMYSGGNMNAGEEVQAEIIKAWTDWFTALGSAVVDGGNPFTPKAKTIAPGGNVKDGSSGILASGYSVIKANSLDEAVKLAKGCPVLKSGASITVFETYNVM